MTAKRFFRFWIYVKMKPLVGSICLLESINTIKNGCEDVVNALAIHGWDLHDYPCGDCGEEDCEFCYEEYF